MLRFQKNLARECAFNPSDALAAYRRLLETGEYVQLFENPEIIARDPVELLYKDIAVSTEPTHQLLSGFRGSSKTTTLFRLGDRLRKDGYTVVRVDVEDYLSTSVAPGPVEFLLFVAVAFEEAIDEMFPGAPEGEPTMWERVKSVFRRVDVEVDPIEVSVEQQLGPISVSAKLKLLLRDDNFVKRLRDSTAGALPALTDEIRKGTEALVNRALRKSAVPEGAVVLIVDSVEHYRGNVQSAADIQASIQTLFDTHAGLLRFNLPSLHVIYTVPPYLRELAPNVAASFGSTSVRMVPAVKIFDRDGEQWRPGIDAMKTLATTRINRALKATGAPETVDEVIADDALEQLVIGSGGLPRELLRLLHEMNLQLESLPVDVALTGRVRKQMVAGRGSIPDEDALVLAQVDLEKAAALPKLAALSTFARLLEYGSVLCYQNAEDWYAVNPLIIDAVRTQVARINARASARSLEEV